MNTRRVFGFVILLAFAFFGSTYGQQTKPARLGSKSSVVTYELPSWGNGSPRLLIELPEGMKVRLRNGPDFDVYSIVRSDGDRSAKIGIFVGHHPDTNIPSNASKKSGSIDSVPVIWRNWRTQEDGKAVHHSEALVENFFPCDQADKAGKEVRKLPPDYPPAPGSTVVIQDPPDGGCGLQMHVFMEASQQEEMDRMVSWIGTLRKKS